AVGARAGGSRRLAAGVVEAQLEFAVGIGLAGAGGLRLGRGTGIETQLKLDLFAAAALLQRDAAVGRIAQADAALAASPGQLTQGDLVIVGDGGGGGGRQLLAARLDRRRIRQRRRRQVEVAARRRLFALLLGQRHIEVGFGKFKGRG